MVDEEVDKASAVDCSCDLCTDFVTLCDCHECKAVRDEALAMIGLNGIDADDLQNAEMHL